MNEMWFNSVQICKPTTNLITSYTPSCMQKSLSYDINAITPAPNYVLHLPSYERQGACSVIHSIHDNCDHLFICRFVSDCSSIIKHCQLAPPEPYIICCISMNYVLVSCLRPSMCVCVGSQAGNVDYSRGMLMDISSTAS